MSGPAWLTPARRAALRCRAVELEPPEHLGVDELRTWRMLAVAVDRARAGEVLRTYSVGLELLTRAVANVAALHAEGLDTTAAAAFAREAAADWGLTLTFPTTGRA